MKTRICVQKEQGLTVCLARASIHLEGPATLAKDDGRMWSSFLRRSVSTAAIHNDDLEIAVLLFYAEKSFENALCFVQRGNNYGDFHWRQRRIRTNKLRLEIHKRLHYPSGGELLVISDRGGLIRSASSRCIDR